VFLKKSNVKKKKAFVFKKKAFVFKKIYNIKKKIFSPKKFFKLFSKLEIKSLSIFYFFNCLIQKKITKRVSEFLKHEPYSYYLHHELQLVNLLIRSKFCITINQAKDLISLNCVFLNFKLVSSNKLKLKTYDLVQLMFSKAFFYYYRYNLNLVTKRTIKVNYCL